MVVLSDNSEHLAMKTADDDYYGGCGRISGERPFKMKVSKQTMVIRVIIKSNY